MSDWFPEAQEPWSGLSVDLPQRAISAETRLYDAFQVDVSGSRSAPKLDRSGPDLVFDADRSPVAVELKVTTRPGQFFSSSSRMVSQAVRYRRQFQDVVRLVLIVLVIPTDEASRSWSPIHARVQRLLRNSNDTDGFDQVLVSIDGSPSVWWEYESASTAPKRFAGLTAAVSRVRGFDVAGEDTTVGPIDRSTEGRATEEPESIEQNGPRRRVLLVADEWASGFGGISTINRGVAIGFAEIGCQVAIVVPAATPDEIDDAKSAGVDLVSPDFLPGVGGKETLLLPPRFEQPNWSPDLIVGHGRILGPYAYAVQNNYFPRAKRVHVVHMDPRRLEKAKEAESGVSRMITAEERDAVEVELAVSADVVAGVGATLTEYIDDSMRGRVNPRRTVATLIPGLKEWEEVADPSDPPSRRKVLLLARADDIHSKGIDVAVRAVRQAVLLSPNKALEPPTLVVRGVPQQHQNAILASLNSLAQPDIEVYLQPYSTSERDLLADLLSSRMVLMPSRHEGFGLAGLEAMAAGVPVLITAASGLARLLMELPVDGDRARPREILDVAGTTEVVVDAWARAIQRILDDPNDAFQRAATLRHQLSGRLAWAKAAQALLDAVDQADPKPEAPKP